MTSDVASGKVARYHRRLFNIRTMTRGAVHAGFSPHAGPFCREKGVQSRVAVVGSREWCQIDPWPSVVQHVLCIPDMGIEVVVAHLGRLISCVH